jgi:CBS domain-containing protein
LLANERRDELEEGCDAVTRIRVQTRTHLVKLGPMTASRLVRCPLGERWVPLEGCRSCPDCGSFTLPAPGQSDPRVACAKGPARRPGDRDPERARVTEAMDGNVLCVDEGVLAKTVMETLASGEHAIALVLDAGGHAIGVVSHRDLATASEAALVRDRMTPFVITLLDSATVADATELILERGLHHVPILCEGKVLGVVSAVGALRWYARNLRSPSRPRGSAVRRTAAVGRP